MYIEGNESTFTHDGKIFLVDDLLRLSETLESTLLEVNVLSWILEYTSTDVFRVHKSDITIPIIVLSTSKWGYVVLDGAHRLTKSINEKLSTIHCKVLNENEFSKLSCISL